VLADALADEEDEGEAGEEEVVAYYEMLNLSPVYFRDNSPLERRGVPGAAVFILYFGGERTHTACSHNELRCAPLE
jgi:hypothetical protein